MLAVDTGPCCTRRGCWQHAAVRAVVACRGGVRDWRDLLQPALRGRVAFIDSPRCGPASLLGDPQLVRTSCKSARGVGCEVNSLRSTRLHPLCGRRLAV